MVSIHRPLGYGPSTLPLRHSAFHTVVFSCISLICIKIGRHPSLSIPLASLFPLTSSNLRLSFWVGPSSPSQNCRLHANLRRLHFCNFLKETEALKSFLRNLVFQPLASPTPISRDEFRTQTSPLPHPPFRASHSSLGLWSSNPLAPPRQWQGQGQGRGTAWSRRLEKLKTWGKRRKSKYFWELQLEELREIWSPRWSTIAGFFVHTSADNTCYLFIQNQISLLSFSWLYATFFCMICIALPLFFLKVLDIESVVYWRDETFKWIFMKLDYQCSKHLRNQKSSFSKGRDLKAMQIRRKHEDLESGAYVWIQAERTRVSWDEASHQHSKWGSVIFAS